MIEFLKRESATQALIIMLSKFDIIKSRYTHDKPYRKDSSIWISAYEIELFAKRHCDGSIK